MNEQGKILINTS